MKKLSLILSMFLVCSIGSINLVIAQIPKVLTYQGIVTGIDGKPVDSLLNMTFKLYQDVSGGQPLFEETQNVPISKGLYTVYLGYKTPLNLPFDNQYFISITMDGIESISRIPFATVPYAFKAESVPDSSISTKQLSKKGASTGQVLTAGENGVNWTRIVNRIIPGENFYVSPDSGSGIVTIGLIDGSIRGNQLVDGTITPQKLGVPASPIDKQLLSYDGIGQVLKWVDPPNGGIIYPYSAIAQNTTTLFSIRNNGNGPAGKFSVSANPSTANALVGENNGIGSAIAGLASGNGPAGSFTVTNISATSSALKVESNSSGIGLDAIMSNTAAKNSIAIRGRSASTGDSSFAVMGTVSSTNPGVNSAGLRGIAASSNEKAFGIWGTHNGKGSAVYGNSKLGIGMYGQSKDSVGIYGIHSDTLGVNPGIYAASASLADSAIALKANISSSNPGIRSAAIVGINSGNGFNGIGVLGQHAGKGVAVQGQSDAGIGVVGISKDSTAIMAYHTGISGSQSAIYAETQSESISASGIEGYASAIKGGIGSAGIKGINKSTNANGYGVSGSHSGLGYGIYGLSNQGNGIVGESSENANGKSGVLGQSSSRTGTGVIGKATSTLGVTVGVLGTTISDSGIAIKGIAATSNGGNPYAGYFQGKLHVTGDITKTYNPASPTGERRAMPIAYGSINAVGLILSGTPNFTARWDAAEQQYVLTINNEIYVPTTYVTTVAPNGVNYPVIPVTGNVPNDALGIRMFNLAGQSIQCNFHFVVYKP